MKYSFDTNSDWLMADFGRPTFYLNRPAQVKIKYETT